MHSFTAQVLSHLWRAHTGSRKLWGGLLSAGVGREVAEANLGLCPPQLHSNMRQPSLWVCTQAVQGSPLPPQPPSLHLLVHLRFPLLCPPSVLSCLHAVLQKWAGISLCLPTCIAHSTRVCCQVPITPSFPFASAHWWLR